MALLTCVAQGQAPRSATDLDHFLGWFVGEYSNNEQVWQQATDGAEHRGQEDRDQEATDHAQEKEGDAERQEEEKAVLKARGIGSHGMGFASRFGRNIRFRWNISLKGKAKP